MQEGKQAQRAGRLPGERQAMQLHQAAVSKQAHLLQQLEMRTWLAAILADCVEV